MYFIYTDHLALSGELRLVNERRGFAKAGWG